MIEVNSQKLDLKNMLKSDLVGLDFFFFEIMNYLPIKHL